MKVGDLIEYLDDSESNIRYPGFIGSIGLVEMEVRNSVRVRWLKSKHSGAYSDFDKSRFKVISGMRRDK